jgi:hypothetical protein
VVFVGRFSNRVVAGFGASILLVPLAIILGLCSLWMSWGSSVPGNRFKSPLLIFPSSGSSRQTESGGSTANPAAPQTDKGSAPPATASPVQSNPSDSAASKPAAAEPSASPGKKKKKKKKKTSAVSKPPGAAAPAPAPAAGADKVVVRNGGTTEPAVQLAPPLSDEEASHQRENTDGLLATTDSNLKQVSTRPLNSSQQDTVTQIRSYMQQAKSASSAGDLERAYNLAFKAHLLSDELVGH